MHSNPPSQYASDGNLAARQHLWRSGRREPAFDLFSWVLDLAGLPVDGTGQVLDVGCGNGGYEAALSERNHRGGCVALDLSFGMLTHVSNAARVQADVMRLPFGESSFDVILAPHMLYHVPDIRTAAHDLRRVLRSGGCLVAVTNSETNLGELRGLVETAVGTGWEMLRPADRHFSLENGADLLTAAFESVVRIDCPPSDLVVTDIDALTGYVASVADHYEDDAGRPWDDVVARVRVLATERLTSQGALRLNTSAGAFVCR